MSLPVIQKMPAAQKRAGKLLLGFFSLALAFTLISRGLDSFSVAQVATTKPGRGGIAWKIAVQGTVEPLSQVAVAVPEGFLVRRVLVGEGSRVEEGDVLVELDLESIQNQLAEARRELEKTELSTELGRVEAELPSADPMEEAELGRKRAEEDRRQAEEIADEAIERVHWDLAEARRALAELFWERDSSEYEDSEEIKAAKQVVRDKERDLEDAVKEKERNMRAADRSVEDAERAAQAARLEQEKQAAQEAAGQESRQLEDRIGALTSADLYKKIARLQSLAAAEGKVTATQSGVVTKLTVEAGSVSGAGGALLLGESEAGAVFRGEVEEENGKRLSRGDPVEILLPGRSKAVTAVIGAVSPPKEKGGAYSVTVPLADLELDPGLSATATVEKRSGREAVVLPLSALHSEGGSTTAGYVFVLRERNTTMGNQTVVEKIPVEVIDKNEKNALVDGSFAQDERVVTASSRSLSPGDRVREDTV